MKAVQFVLYAVRPKHWLRLLLLSCCFIFIVGCSPKVFSGLKSAGSSYSPGMACLFKAGITESLVYRTTVNYNGREFSALTYFNALNDSVYKIVLLSTFGNTLLEAEISAQQFRVDNVISYLNRKPVIKLLERDWRLLLHGNFSKAVPLLYSKNDNEVVFDFADERDHHFYHYLPAVNYVGMIEAYKGKSRKTVVTVRSYQDLQPTDFSIDHPSLKLKIAMMLLKKTSNESAE